MGIVTNTKITHATPAAGYAHAASRLWEGDVHMHGVTGGCKDIAHQLIYNNTNIQVDILTTSVMHVVHFLFRIPPLLVPKWHNLV